MVSTGKFVTWPSGLRGGFQPTPLPRLSSPPILFPCSSHQSRQQRNFVSIVREAKSRLENARTGPAQYFKFKRPLATKNTYHGSSSLKYSTPPKIPPTDAEIQNNLLARSGTLFNRDGCPTVSSMLLRDACQCPQCVDPASTQRNFSFVDIPSQVKAVSHGTSPHGVHTIIWENDIPGYSNHTSTFSSEEVKDLAHNTNPFRRKNDHSQVLWDKRVLYENKFTLPYDDFMHSDASLLETMKALLAYGLVFVSGIPTSPDSVTQLVERIGPIRNTFYGSTWDVQSKPNAENVAYTDKDLGFHMDLLYMTQVPAFQFLHCMQNTCTGGETKFVDTVMAATIMRKEHPNEYSSLCKSRVTYSYHNQNHHYEHDRLVIRDFKSPLSPSKDDASLGSPGSPPLKVFWSPPFVGRLINSKKDYVLASFLKASKLFENILKRPDLLYETRLEEGTCVIFHNTRIAHARNTFDLNSGKRWLRGAYLDSQDLLSKLHSLELEEN